MTKDKLLHYEGLLKNRLRVLSSEHEPSEEEPVGQVADVLDLSAFKQGQFVDISLGSIKRAEISAIKDAIQRCRDGEYGICEECGAKIPEKRLEVSPAGKCCVACQSKLEVLQRKRKGYLGFDRNPELVIG